MQQGGGVDELDAGGEVDMALALIAAQTGCAQRQHRPQPLVARQLRDQQHLALHLVEDDAVDAFHVSGAQTAQPVQ